MSFQSLNTFTEHKLRHFLMEIIFLIKTFFSAVWVISLTRLERKQFRTDKMFVLDVLAF